MSRKDNLQACKSSKDFDQYLNHHGAEVQRQSGSHRIYKANGSQIIVPQHSGDLSSGLVKSLIKAIVAAGLILLFLMFVIPMIL